MIKILQILSLLFKSVLDLLRKDQFLSKNHTRDVSLIREQRVDSRNHNKTAVNGIAKINKLFSFVFSILSSRKKYDKKKKSRKNRFLCSLCFDGWRNEKFMIRLIITDNEWYCTQKFSSHRTNRYFSL